MRSRGYAIYSLVTTLFQEAALAVIMLWLLPRFGVNVPLWGVILLMVALGVYAYITYRLSKRTLDKEPITPSNAMIGCTGKATMPLAPEGCVRVRGELWKASAVDATIEKDEEIIVLGIEGLKLFVAPVSSGHHGVGEAAERPG